MSFSNLFAIQVNKVFSPIFNNTTELLKSLYVDSSSIGHFRVAVNFILKARLSAKFFI